MEAIPSQQTTASTPFLKRAINKLKGYRRTGKGAENMPKLLRARVPQDKAEEQKVRKLANSRHAPGGYLRLLEAVAQANPSGDLYLITDNLSSHKSPPIREWLKNHPRVEQVFIPPWGRVGSRHAGGVVESISTRSLGRTELC
jgi:hypothetical protein